VSPYLTREVAGTAVVQLMVAVVFVVVTVIELTQDCARADGAMRKTNRRGADTERTRINLNMAQVQKRSTTRRARGSASSVS
jgi:hypothetical protein